MELIIYLFILLFINNFIQKKKLLLSITGHNHQSYVNNSVPLIGGIFLLLPTIYLFFPNYLIFLLAYISLFLLGLLSDLKIFESAKKRFLIQFIIILVFVISYRLEVTPTKIYFFDSLIQKTYWSYFFTAFCLMILINGSNFIDGLNGLLLGYFTIIVLLLFKLDLINSLTFNNEILLYFTVIIFVILMLNFTNKLFLGDNGAYSLSFLLGFLLIETYNNNQNISPYFIIVLLWYPCFENLFSIIRKNMKRKNPLDPDTEHFHQKLFILLKKRFNITSLKSNILSSIIILSFNFVIFYIASQAIGHSIFQIFLLVICIFSYFTMYVLINKMIK
tara:strand:- start:41 stop:1039 length:999 start_codon:yes stop_codon:yes gene_type:complete